MLVLVGEGYELRLDRRAVARSGRLYLSVVEWGVGDGCAQRVVHLLVGVCRPAWQLFEMSWRRHIRESVIVGLARLFLHILEVNRAAVDAHRCAGLHSRCCYAVSGDALGEVEHGWLGASASWHLMLAHVHESVEECSGCYHYCLCSERDAPHRLYAHRLAVLYDQLAGFVLPDVEVVGAVELRAPFPDELAAVALRSRAPYCRSLSAVEHAELY